MTNLSLAPLFRHSIGYDQLSDMLQGIFEGEDSSPAYPPYNIEKHGENEYLISMAVAGFSQEDLNIVNEKDHLTISGRIHKKEDTSNKVDYLHRGIATRAFERTFRLAEHMQVVDAHLSNGLLNIKLIRNIPEAMKPKIIPINNTKLIEC